MSKVWPTLTANQRQYLGELSAGKRQINVLESLLTNWEGVDKAMVAAADSAGSAERENAKYLDSIAGKTKALESAMQELSTTSVSDDLIKWFLDLEKSVINFQTSIGGITPLILGLVTLFSSKLIPALGVVWKLVGTSLVSSFQNVKDAIMLMTYAIKTGNGALTAFQMTASGWVTIILAGITAVSALVGWINKQNQAQKELRQQTIATAEETAKSSKTLNELYAKYQALYKTQNRSKEQEEELTTTSKSLEEALGDRASVLKTLTDGTEDYNTELTKVMQTQASLDFGKATSGIEAFKKELDLSDYTIDIPVDFEFLDKGSVQNVISQTAIDDLKEFSNYYENMWVESGGNAKASIKNVSQMQGYLSALESTYGDLNTRLSQAKHDGDSLLVTQISQNELYVKLGTTIDGLKSKLSEYNSLLVTQAVSEKEMNGEYPATLQAYASFREGIISNIGATGDWATTLRTMIDELFPQFKGKLDDLIDPDYVSHVSEMTDALSASESQLSTLSSAYKTLSEAQDEYNKNGSFSIDTLSKLLSLEPEYLKYLIDEKGNINLNKDAYEDLVKAKVDALKTDLLNKYTAEMDDLTHSSKLQKEAVDKQVDSTESYLRGIEEKKKIDANVKEQQAELTDEYNNTTAAVDNLTSSLYDQADVVERITEAYDKQSSAMDNLQSAYSTVKDAAKEYQENGQISVDTLQSLLDLQPEYLQYLLDENGQFSLNAEALDTLTQAMLDNMKAAVNEDLQTNIDNLMESFLSGAIGIDEYDKKIVEYREQAAAEKEAIDATSASLAEKIDMLKQAQDAYDDQSSALDTAQSAYETLTSAINEYNKTGVLSIDTFQKIMALSPEYLQMYFNQATAADSATNAIYTQAQALQIAKIQELQASAANDVYLYSIGKYSQMSPLAQSAIAGIGSTSISTGSNLLIAAADATTFADTVIDKFNALRTAAGQSTIDTSDFTSGMNNIISAYQGIASSIASIDVGSLSNLSSATSGAGSAANSASNAYDDLVKITMEMLKQQTQDQIDLYQQEIDALKKEHDAAVDSLKDQLDKYKDLIDAKKKSLEATKEERKYQEELADKQKSVTQIQQRLDEISLDTSESGIAEKMKLQEELADAQQELDDYQYDHQVSQQEDALDAEEAQYEQHINGQIAMLDAYYAHVEETYQSDIDALQTYLDQEGRIRLDAIALIQSGAQSFYNQLSVWNQNYGDMTEQELQTLISNAGTAGSSISSSMGSAANSVGGVGRAAGEAAGKFQELTQQMQEYYRWLNLLNSDTGAHENSAYWSTRGGYPTHHKGLDSGFVGDNKTAGNEMFIKALKGEVFVTPNQQNNFMNKVIPSMISNAGSSITADNLISINVSGNLDSSVVPELKTTIKSSFESLTKTLASRGIVRTANNFQ